MHSTEVDRQSRTGLIFLFDLISIVSPLWAKNPFLTTGPLTKRNTGRSAQTNGNKLNIVEVNRGGATVLKVGGGNFASGASQKNFLPPPPPTFWPVGGQNIA